MTSLRVFGLAKRYGRVHALTPVTFALDQGSCLAVLGPNGAGKSTLFGCLLGLTQPSAGHATWGENVINESQRGNFGYLAERVALYPQLTVRENAAFLARLKGIPVEEADWQLERVGLSRVQGRVVRQLSKGMLQRVGLAIALSGHPSVIVLDEPFNGLDPALLDIVQAILTQERQRGATLLISTHAIPAVQPVATHVAILLRGKLAAFGPVGEFTNFQSLESAYGQIARHQGPGEIEQELFA